MRLPRLAFSWMRYAGDTISIGVTYSGADEFEAEVAAVPALIFFVHLYRRSVAVILHWS